MFEFNVQGEEILQKKAKEHGSGAIVYVPKGWAGKQVSVVLETEHNAKAIEKQLDRKTTIVYSYYVLDLVHRGHLLQMRNAKAIAGKDGISIVGILTEKAVSEKKTKPPVLSFDERMLLAQSIRYNDFVVAQETYSPIPNVLSLQPTFLMESQSHNKKDLEKTIKHVGYAGIKVITTPYYPLTSSSKIKEIIKHE